MTPTRLPFPGFADKRNLRLRNYPSVTATILRRKEQSAASPREARRGYGWGALHLLKVLRRCAARVSRALVPSTLRVKHEINRKQSLPLVPFVKLPLAERAFLPWASRFVIWNWGSDVLPVVVMAPPVFLVRFGRMMGLCAAIGRRAALRWCRLLPAFGASWSSPWVSASPTAFIVLARLGPVVACASSRHRAAGRRRFAAD